MEKITCPRCGAPAYVGLLEVECSKGAACGPDPEAEPEVLEGRFDGRYGLFMSDAGMDPGVFVPVGGEERAFYIHLDPTEPYWEEHGILGATREACIAAWKRALCAGGRVR